MFTNEYNYLGLGDSSVLKNKSKLLSDIDSMNVLGSSFIYIQSITTSFLLIVIIAYSFTGKYISEYNDKSSENYKPILSVYSGVFNATAYSVFANSTYNLGTDSSRLIVNELANNIIPVGGFPYHLAKRTGDNDLSLGTRHINHFIVIRMTLLLTTSTCFHSVISVHGYI